MPFIRLARSLDGSARWVTQDAKLTVAAGGDTTLHESQWVNDSGSSSTGLVYCGLAFEDGQMPSGQLPQARASGFGFDYRSVPIHVSRYASGAMKHCTLFCNLGTVAGSATVTVEVYAKTGSVTASTFNPLTEIAAASDLATEIRNHTGSSDNTGVGDIDYSLQTAVGTSTRRETRDDTDFIVEFFAWQKGDEHHTALNYLRYWLDTDGVTVLAKQWWPVFSQHWLVDDPYGVAMTKQLRNYDATVKVGASAVDTRAGLAHAYGCRWMSLDADADPHWIDAGSTPKPTLRLVYSVESRKTMARTGYLPPLNWSASYDQDGTDTYTPLGRNGHRANINATGAYPGRGAVSNMDAIAITEQSADAWKRAKVAATAGLSVYVNYVDHRTIDIEEAPTLIPQPIGQQGANSYADLGSELLHGWGSDWTLTPDAAVGGTGTFTNYDPAHTVNYSGMMAFVLGDPALRDATLMMAERVLTDGNYDEFGHDHRPFGYNFSARQADQSIPNDAYGVLPDIVQERSLAWNCMTLFQAWALLPDGDRHRGYLENVLLNLSDWLETSLNFFPADHLAYGGFIFRSQRTPSPWMQNWTAMIVYQWLPAWEATVAADTGGFSEVAAQTLKIASNVVASGRLYALEAFRAPWPCDDDFLNFVAGEDHGFFEFDATYVNDGTFTATRLSGDTASLNWTNGDKVIVWTKLTSGSNADLPTGFAYGQVYYMVAASGDTFKLSATDGGTAITAIGSGTAGLGISAASFAQEVAGVGGTPVPRTDNYATIAGATISAARLRGAVEASVETTVATFLSNVSRRSYAPWNYDGDQEAAVSVPGGQAISNVTEFFDDSSPLTQGTGADRPVVEKDDIPGLTLAKSTGTQHLEVTPLDPIRAIAGTIYDYGAGLPRRVAAIDTDSGTVTDKAAFEIILE